MIDSKVIKFYALVVFCFFSDIALLIGMIWSSLELTSSPAFLGVVLSISVLIPFFLKKVVPAFDMASLALKGLFLFRLTGYAILFFLAQSGALMSVEGFLVGAVILGLLNFCTTSSFEATNTRFVLAGYIDSRKSARVMQTVLQVGAFGGAFIGGALLDATSLKMLITIIALLDIMVCVGGLVLKVKAPKSHVVNKYNVEKGGSVDWKSRLYLLCFALGMVGFHVGSFNTLTPVIYQDVNQWSSGAFGLASGVAGVGAFMAAILPLPRINTLLFGFMLFLADFVHSFSTWQSLSIGVCFFIGFSINSVRINLREQMINLAIDDEQADKVGALSSAYFVLFQSAGPMLVGTALSDKMLGVEVARSVYPVLAGTVIIALIIQKISTSYLSYSLNKS